MHDLEYHCGHAQMAWCQRVRKSEISLDTGTRQYAARAGVRKCRARFETLLRGPTQWRVEIFEGVHQGVG